MSQKPFYFVNIYFLGGRGFSSLAVIAKNEPANGHQISMLDKESKKLLLQEY